MGSGATGEDSEFTIDCAIQKGMIMDVRLEKNCLFSYQRDIQKIIDSSRKYVECCLRIPDTCVTIKMLISEGSDD